MDDCRDEPDLLKARLLVFRTYEPAHVGCYECSVASGVSRIYILEKAGASAQGRLPR